MPDYRLYALDRCDHIVAGLDSECVNDDAALAIAAMRFGSFASFEVWQGTRRVTPAYGETYSPQYVGTITAPNAVGRSHLTVSGA